MSKINYYTSHNLKQKIMTQTGTQSYYTLRYAFDAKEYSLHQTRFNVTVLNGERFKVKCFFFVYFHFNNHRYLGASHGDSALMFYVPTCIKYKVPLKDHPVALKMRQLLRLYTNFAKYG